MPSAISHGKKIVRIVLLEVREPRADSPGQPVAAVSRHLLEFTFLETWSEKGGTHGTSATSET